MKFIQKFSKQFWVSTLCRQLFSQDLRQKCRQRNQNDINVESSLDWMAKSQWARYSLGRCLEREGYLSMYLGWYIKRHNRPAPKTEASRILQHWVRKAAGKTEGEGTNRWMRKKSRASKYKQFHIPQDLCIGWSYDSLPGWSHSWLFVILLVSA